MTDLRTKIAKVLHHQFGPSLGAAEGGWDREPRGTQEMYLADADAVIRELKLEREDGECLYCHAQLPCGRWVAWDE